MLFGLKNISFNVGTTALLDKVNLSLERGERLCLVGRNGMGKSTLMRVITGEQAADDGEIIRSPGLKIAKLVQDVPRDVTGTVYDVIAGGLGELGRVVAEYHHLLIEAPDDMERMGTLQARIDAEDGWTLESRVQTEIDRQNLPADAEFSALSGGLKRRVLLARALVAQPDVLLLDEPTNHLDIASITALEEFLSTYEGTLLFITHDRAFLRRLATRIIELDRGWLTSWPCTYDEYLRRKAEVLHAESKQNALFDKRLAQEEVWIRRGIEARRTRDQGRVKRLVEMRNQYSQRRNLQGQARMEISAGEKSGKLVAEAINVSVGFNGTTILRNINTTILRGDKVGFIGPNGAGKTTLLNLLLGKLEPSGGEMKLGSNLQIAYFDQLRATLDENKTVVDNIGDGKDTVEVNGVRKHVMGYLQDFLFAPDRARQPVRSLSGGERNRLLLAQLFAKPSNLLVLDEPTNDLDVETLDLLEELIQDYSGTVLLVSHDREFINNVVTRSLVFEGEGRVNEYVGGYEDWLRQRPKTSAAPVLARANPVNVAPQPTPKVKASAGLTPAQYKELETLPRKIEKLENEQLELGEQLSAAYSSGSADVKKIEQRTSKLEQELAAAYAQWEKLEALKNG